MAFSHRIVYLLTVLLAWESMAATAQAGPLLDWLRRRRTQNTTTFYTPAVGANGYATDPGATTAYYGASGSACGPGYCQQTVVQYMPEVGYRTVWSPVPVTQYRTTTSLNPTTGLPITCTRPCVEYQYQARRVPYTTYRPTYAQVPVTMPASSVAPANYTYGYSAGYAAGGESPTVAGYSPSRYSPAYSPSSVLPAAYYGSNYYGNSAGYAPQTSWPSAATYSGYADGCAGCSAAGYDSSVAIDPYGASSTGAASSVDSYGATPWVPVEPRSGSSLAPYQSGGTPADQSPAISGQDARAIQQQGGPTGDPSGAYFDFGQPPQSPQPRLENRSGTGAFEGSSYQRRSTSDSGRSLARPDPTYRWNQPRSGDADLTTTGAGRSRGVTQHDTLEENAARTPTSGTNSRPSTAQPSSAQPWYDRSAPSGQQTADAVRSQRPVDRQAAPSDDLFRDEDNGLRFRVRPLPDMPKSGETDWSNDIPSLLDPNDRTAFRTTPPVPAGTGSATPIRWATLNTAYDDLPVSPRRRPVAAEREGAVNDIRSSERQVVPLGPPQIESTELNSVRPVRAVEDNGWRPSR